MCASPENRMHWEDDSFSARKFWTYFRRLLVHRNAFKQMRYRRHHTLHWYSKRPQEDDFM